MFICGRLQLRDSGAAEDTVQDTLVTALEKHDAFARRSAFETWVFGILKNKLLERLRQQRRYVADIQQRGNGGYIIDAQPDHDMANPPF
ncbi:hypothetical protein HVA01_10010 [Halovibrio variabilis]|uniref:RNA polymerase sigma-70 region 2 domain-containing protein n=1 Tax=Halovibrio variabilis TaxID=31910 RepID=A0A511UL60_9GAMM|nr:sigma factor [Halovibrio variabilis]GEN27355.1 hypothetical protein HVA01_10010 [Halovibrio variabilis]